MDTDLPKRFIVYRDGVGVVSHGVEFADGGVVVKSRGNFDLATSLAYLLEHQTGPGDMVIQYDDDPLIEAGRKLQETAKKTTFEPIWMDPRYILGYFKVDSHERE